MGAAGIERPSEGRRLSGAAVRGSVSSKVKPAMIDYLVLLGR